MSLSPVYVYFVFVNVFSKGGSYTVNVIVLSHPIFETLSLLNSLWSPIIKCCRNNMFRNTCKVLLRMKCMHKLKEE